MPVHYRMKFDGQTPKQNHFSVDVTLGDVGLYFYYFRPLHRLPPHRARAGQLRRGQLAGGRELADAPFTSPASETPDSIKGKVFYQIFPDRFCEGVENKPMPFPDRLYQADKHAEPFWQPNDGQY